MALPPRCVFEKRTWRALREESADSAQPSDGTVELEWCVGNKMIRFVADVVPGHSGFSLSRTDLEALGTKVDLKIDKLRLTEQDVTRDLSTTLAGQCVISQREARTGVFQPCTVVHGEWVGASRPGLCFQAPVWTHLETRSAD